MILIKPLPAHTGQEYLVLVDFVSVHTKWGHRNAQQLGSESLADMPEAEYTGFAYFWQQNLALPTLHSSLELDLGRTVLGQVSKQAAQVPGGSKTT